MHSLPLHLARMNSWNSVWKIGGVVLLAYVIVRGFSTPLQPGLVEASPTRLSPGKATISLSAVGQPFLRDQETLEDFQLVLRSEEELLKTQILDISEHRVTASINVPNVLPSPALDAFLFTPSSGTLFLPKSVLGSHTWRVPVGDQIGPRHSGETGHCTLFLLNPDRALARGLRIALFLAASVSRRSIKPNFYEDKQRSARFFLLNRNLF